MSDKERKEFLESIKPPAKEKVHGEIDYSNVYLNASRLSDKYKKEHPEDGDIHQGK